MAEDDGRVFTQDLRFEFPLQRARRKSDSNGAYSSPDVGVALSSGDFSQTLALGQEIEIHDVTFFGPGALDGEFDLALGSVLWHYHGESTGRVSLDGYLGLAVNHVDVTISSGGVSDSDRRVTLGHIFGGRWAYAVADRFDLFAQFLISLPTHQVGDVGVRWRLSRRFVLEGGWRFLEFDTNEDRDVTSSIEIEHDGPVLSLVFSR